MNYGWGIFDGVCAVEFLRNIGVGLWYHDIERLAISLAILFVWVWFRSVTDIIPTP